MSESQLGPHLVGLLAGIVTGFLTGAFNTYGAGIVTWLGAAAGAIVVTWLVAGLVTEMARPETDNTSPFSPLASRRGDQAFGLAVGLVVGLGVGLVVGLGVGLANGQLARGFADGIRPPALTSTDVNGQDDAEHLFCPSLRSAIEAVPRAPNEPYARVNAAFKPSEHAARQAAPITLSHGQMFTVRILCILNLRPVH